MRKVTLFLFILFCLVGCSDFQQKEVNTIKNEAILYLENKYEEKFKILTLKENTSTGLITIKAESKTDPPIYFAIFRYKKSNEYSDTYINSIISNELQKRDLPKLKELYALKIHSVNMNIDLSENLIDNAKINSLEKVNKEDTNLVHNYTVFIEKKFSNDDKFKILSFINYLKDKSVMKARIQFIFFKNPPKISADVSSYSYLTNFKEEEISQIISISPTQFKSISDENDIKTLE